MAVSLSKITLEKQGDSHKIDLSKASDQQITINLNWSQQKKGGFFSSLFGGNKEIDLDLGIYWELTDGTAGMIDGLQFSKGRGGARNQLSRQGRYTDLPWVWHCGDDRSGSSKGGENILVNPKGIQDLRRLVVYCFIYDGVANWAQSDAVVTVKVPNQPEIVVEMGKQSDQRTFCAIASIDFIGSQMSVRKDINFFRRHAECSQYYNWGFEFSAGAK
ncbi:stress protein [Glaesserella parasuis]|uniref:stress protein n=1 Tax=Glaesserella parasuis TaxID=738 RepID=UPI0024364ED8|nr:stress protein [Glaesserella parasuis]MDG6300321.1 stress protein [Glaesserella parasuis]MDG6375516.1 stress protein [Glaesserella parasuis]MDP0354680.1 stress protein [Glaesserella parasuis]